MEAKLFFRCKCGIPLGDILINDQDRVQETLVRERNQVVKEPFLKDENKVYVIIIQCMKCKEVNRIRAGIETFKEQKSKRGKTRRVKR